MASWRARCTQAAVLILGSLCALSAARALFRANQTGAHINEAYVHSSLFWVLNRELAETPAPSWAESPRVTLSPANRPSWLHRWGNHKGFPFQIASICVILMLLSCWAFSYSEAGALHLTGRQAATWRAILSQAQGKIQTEIDAWDSYNSLPQTDLSTTEGWNARLAAFKTQMASLEGKWNQGGPIFA